MKRLLLLLGIILAFSIAWVSFREIPLLVIGQPTSTGLMQNSKEEPFFRNLRSATGLPVKVTYSPLDSVGFKDTYQLAMLKDGLFDLVSLRFIQNSDAEPGLFGIDPVGMSSDWATARKMVRNYSATVDRHLQDTFGAKLLGVWTFGPQVFFCRKPIRGVADLRGMKVRVAGQFMAKMIQALGATPAVIPFDDTKNALAIGLIDCAITSGASGNFAGWPEHTRYYFPLAAQFGLNGYAISLRKWKRFSRQEQETLQAAFDEYIEGLWQFSQELERDVANCNTGLTCRDGTPYRMVLVTPSAEDVQTLKEITRTRLLPEWFKKCEDVHPGCRSEWLEKAMPSLQ